MDHLIVSTERLGWPKRRWWLAPINLLFPGEFQGRMQYEDSPDEPTATCHLQHSDEQPALCGYQWEGLIAVPGSPAWADLHPEMRCDECASLAEMPAEDPTGRTYRYRWSAADEA